MWESKSIIFFRIVSSNPSKILNAIIKVATPKEIPITEIDEMRVMKRESFLDSVNFLEIKKGNDISNFFFELKLNQI